MNKVIRTTWIILLLTVASGMARAQQGLQIASVFQKYGKQKGVTMVELSNEMLETYQMTLYKSLVFKDVEEALPTILNCLDADKKKAKKVKEVVAGGQIQSGYYQLPQLKEDVTVTCLCQEVNAYRVDIQAAVQILFMSVDLCFRLGSMTDFRFKSG